MEYKKPMPTPIRLSFEIIPILCPLTSLSTPVSLFHREPFYSLNSIVGAVDADERVKLLGQKGVTVWFTGLSASGKVRLQ